MFLAGYALKKIANRANFRAKRANFRAKKANPAGMYIRALVENKADMEFYSTQHFYQWIHDKQYGITHGMELIYRILVQD